MSANSEIAWTDHTFNPWWGCTKISEGCTHCYAHTFARRLGLQLWGTKADRKASSDDYWQQPLDWNRRAAEAGEQHRVFCASMADVFEARPELDAHRERLWKLISATPHLTWLLLSKRLENTAAMVPSPWLRGGWPGNVWLGATVENQRRADERIPVLLEHNAVVRFLSAEPLVGPVDISRHLVGERRVDWVIVGGESGHGARPMQPEWARSLRNQCVDAGVAFHFKQWGNWAPSGHGQLVRLRSKKLAGRKLDGRTWDEFPSRRTGRSENPILGIASTQSWRESALAAPALVVVRATDAAGAPTRTLLHGVTGILCRCDVRDRKAVERTVARVRRKVADAGVGTIVLAPDEGTALWRRLATKRAEALACCQTAFARVLDQVVAALEAAGFASREPGPSARDYEGLL